MNQNKQIWKKKKKKKKRNKPIWPRFSHNPNTEHKKNSNSYKIKLNQNKQIWKKEKEKNKSIWPSLMVGRRTSDGGTADVVVHGERRSSTTWWTSISDGMVNTDPLVFLLSLCLSLFSDEKSKWCCWKVLEEKKK